MNPTEDEAGPLQRSDMAQAVARLYESVGGVVLRTLADRFRLSPADAEVLLWTACFDAVMRKVEKPESWAIVNASNGAKTLRRWRDQGTAAPPPDITVEELEALREVAPVGKALGTLTASGREALRLRFREGRSYAEIAAELDVTQRYAKLLVFRSLARLLAIQRAGGAGQDTEDEEQAR